MKTETTVLIGVTEVVLDFDVYPRTEVDSQHVRYIKDVIESGHELPPIVIDAKTKRVVDGFHRVKAYQKLLGKETKIQAIEKKYKDDGELFADAIRYNAQHGSNLTTYDRVHCLMKAIELGVSDASLADCLRVDITKIGSLKIDRTAKTNGLVIPIKRTIAHMAGQKLTQNQVSANRKLSGMQQTFYIYQIITLIDNDLVDTENENVIKGLKRLQKLLDELF